MKATKMPVPKAAGVTPVKLPPNFGAKGSIMLAEKDANQDFGKPSRPPRNPKVKKTIIY